ncbi:MAG: protoporphyrinogen/coproporphyrinogen oxidase, partial [Candidatus Binatia bacterium]
MKKFLICLSFFKGLSTRCFCVFFESSAISPFPPCDALLPCAVALSVIDRAVSADARSIKKGNHDESLGSFVKRRLGREALERVAQPLVGGIYTADPDHLSLTATLPRFREMERRHRSLILALWRASRRDRGQASGASGARWSLFVTFAEGMEEVVRILAERLPQGSIRLKESVVAVEPRGPGWIVRLSDRSAIEADSVILGT